MTQSTAPPLASHRAEQARGTNTASDCRMYDRQRHEEISCPSEAAVGAESLKYLRDDDRDGDEVLLLLEGEVQPFDMQLLDPVEEVCPGVRVDDQHLREMEIIRG